MTVYFRSSLNQKGQTHFLEDNPDWFQKVRSRHPELRASLIHYNTRRSQWKELLKDPASLRLSMPLEIVGIKWDVILVDAPNGWSDAQPGRMKSIYMASELIKRGGHVFVHDCNRTVEAVYARRYLGEKNLLASVGRLRHYQSMQIRPEESRRY